MQKWRYNVSYLPRDHDIEVTRDFAVGPRILPLGSIGLTEVEIMALVIPVSIPIPVPRFRNGQISRLFDINCMRISNLKKNRYHLLRNNKS